jgi:outer membrane lipopolysaccharide assembly protein LptE/RlpB
MNRRLFCLCSLIALTLPGCAGYHIAGSKPTHLENITKLYVPTFENLTLEPRLGVLVTDAVIKQIQATGAYKIVDESSADATLKGKIATTDRTQWRSVDTNTLRTSELLMRLKIEYKVTDKAGLVLRSSKVQSTSYVVLDPNWQTSERQLLSETAERLSVTLSDDLANGW